MYRIILSFCLLVLSSHLSIAKVEVSDISEDILLEAGNPVDSRNIDLSVLKGPKADSKQAGTLSFTINPVYHTPEEAEAYLQGSGIALALVEYKKKYFIAGLDYSEGVEQWVYSEIQPVDGEPLSVSIGLSGSNGAYSVAVNQRTAFEGLKSVSTLQGEPLTFYGDREADITVSAIRYSSVRLESEVDPDDESVQSRFRRASKVRDVSIGNKSKMIYRGGLLTLKGDAYRGVMSSLPEEILDLELSKVVFVDNEIGNDSNTGHWPENVGINGPKASINAAIEQVSDGGVIVLMPGYGLYLEGFTVPEGKSLSIVPIGDLDIGPEESIVAAMKKMDGVSKDKLQKKYNNLKYSR